MSVVIQNLKEAIIGESTAETKYRLFAEKAKKEGLKEIKKLFSAISTAEAIHIKNHLKAIEKITNNSIDLNSFVKIDQIKLKESVKSTKDLFSNSTNFIWSNLFLVSFSIYVG